jgi:2-phosphoglycerate kinase
MNKLLFLGGTPRTGKTTIVSELLKQHVLNVVSTDALAESIRNVLTDDPFRILKEVKLEGYVKYKNPETDKVVTKNLSEYSQHKHPEHENNMVLRGVLGEIDHYTRQKDDILVEGCIFDAEWLQRHDFGRYDIKVAFVGFSKARVSHFEP